MNINFKISLITFLTFFISNFLFAQKDFQGKVYYESNTSTNTDFSRPDMSEERKQEIANRMRSALEKVYILTFNKDESIYKEEVDETSTTGVGGRGARFRAMMSSFSANNQYKNVKEKIFLQEQEFFGKEFLITDELPELEWKMIGETKKIGDYICFKATALKTITDVNVTSLRPSSEEEDKKEGISKEVEVVAWYTMQIPINQGPGEYWGLPGLILEVNQDDTTITCSKIIINSKENEEIIVPAKGKKITKEKYNKIVAKKVEEMKANFRSRGQGRNRS